MNRPSPNQSKGTVPEPKRALLYRQRPDRESEWGAWQIATLGIPSLLVKAEDRPDEYEVEEVMPVSEFEQRLKEVERQRDEAEERARDAERRWTGPGYWDTETGQKHKEAIAAAEKAEAALAANERHLRIGTELAVELMAEDREREDPAGDYQLGFDAGINEASKAISAYFDRLAGLTQPSSTPLQQDPEVGKDGAKSGGVEKVLEELAATLQAWARSTRREAVEVVGEAAKIKRKWLAMGYDAAADLLLTADLAAECETCGGDREGPLPTTAGAEHGERPAKCPDCTQPEEDPELPGQMEYRVVAEDPHGTVMKGATCDLAVAIESAEDSREDCRMTNVRIQMHRAPTEWRDLAVEEAKRMLKAGLDRDPEVPRSGVIAIPDCPPFFPNHRKELP